MKVGILTLPLWHNYGGILQAHALRKAAENLGHEAVLIDVYRSPAGQLEIGINRLKRILRRLIRGAHAPWYPDQHELTKISQATRKFVLENINPKTPHMAVDGVLDMANTFDALIVGSDQVWRREYMPDLATYCLALSEKLPRRISYAASMGVDDWRFDPEETVFLANALRKFDAISVREEQGVELLSQKANVKATRVCDPTLLFDSDYYCRLAKIQPVENSRVERVFTYVLDLESSSLDAINDVVQQVGGTAFNIMPTPFGPQFRSNHSHYFFSPVEEWINAFNECDFVITDSFHGCVFSLIFNRPFVAVTNMQRGGSRFESLLSRYAIDDRLFDSFAEIDISRVVPIDWHRVNKIREKERLDGMNFLQSALGTDSDSYD